jgi:Na+-translocating ferredoxin:NAD+ oxidoreductase RnfG subunit
MRESGYHELESGGMLETSDHVGAAVGAFICGILVIPVWGAAGTLILFMIFMLTVIPVSLLCRHGKAAFAKDSAALKYRSAGYFLFGTAASVIIWSNMLAMHTSSGEPLRYYEKLKSLAEGFKAETVSAKNGQGKHLEYLRLSDKAGRDAGYVFSSDKLAPGVRGYGGEVALGIRVNPAGMLQDFKIIESNEAPEYLDMLKEWSESLIGRNIFSDNGLKGIDTVTGATFSSKAILLALTRAGDNFFKEVISGKGGKASSNDINGQGLENRGIFYLIGIFAVAILVSFKGGFKSRFAVLLLTLSIGGIMLNVQYSTDEIMTLLSFKSTMSFSLIFFLAVLVPGIGMIAGNYYCGYVCPFGALQEIVSHVLPGRFKPVLDDRKMLAGRQVKYILLFIITVLYFLSWNRKISGWDPLVCFFSSKVSTVALAAASMALVGSLFYFRFWCRYLCPAGAFLSLLGSLCLLRRYMPFKIFKNCEMGVRNMREMDCIYCDRCRQEFKPKLECCSISGSENLFSRWLSRVFVYLVLASALLLAGYSIHEFYNSFEGGSGNQQASKQLQLPPAETKIAKPVPEKAAAEEEMRPGISRDVNMEKLNKMLKSGKLSDKEADFYRKIE